MIDSARTGSNWQSEHDRREVVDFLSEGVGLFERQVGNTRREIRCKRARLDVLRLEIDRLRKDVEQWGEIVNRETPSEALRRAHRKLIEKSRGIAALVRLGEMLERDIALLEPKLKEDDVTFRALRQELGLHSRAIAFSDPHASLEGRRTARPR